MRELKGPKEAPRSPYTSLHCSSRRGQYQYQPKPSSASNKVQIRPNEEKLRHAAPDVSSSFGMISLFQLSRILIDILVDKDDMVSNEWLG